MAWWKRRLHRLLQPYLLPSHDFGLQPVIYVLPFALLRAGACSACCSARCAPCGPRGTAGQRQRPVLRVIHDHLASVNGRRRCHNAQPLGFFAKNIIFSSSYFGVNHPLQDLQISGLPGELRSPYFGWTLARFKTQNWMLASSVWNIQCGNMWNLD